MWASDLANRCRNCIASHFWFFYSLLYMLWNQHILFFCCYSSLICYLVEKPLDLHCLILLEKKKRRKIHKNIWKIHKNMGPKSHSVTLVLLDIDIWDVESYFGSIIMKKSWTKLCLSFIFESVAIVYCVKRIDLPIGDSRF